MQRIRTHRVWWLGLLAVMLITLIGCGGTYTAGEARHAGLAELGEALFEDPRLSADGRVSCSTCHDPSHGFTDGRDLPLGASGRIGTRNATSLLDVATLETFFWDGRETDLDVVVLQPLTNAVEHGNPDLAAVEKTLNSIPEYREQFKRLSGKPPNAKTAGEALAAYIRSLDRSITRFERYLSNKGPIQLTHDELAGLDLFRGKANCVSCHTIDNGTTPLTDGRFHHAGIGFDKIAGDITVLLERINEAELHGDALGRLILEDQEIAELGRFAITKEPADLGAFRTPTLRNVANTAPYMHDGSVATLSDALERELYYRGIALGRPIALTVEEQQQLLAFLRTLSIEQHQAQ